MKLSRKEGEEVVRTLRERHRTIKSTQSVEVPKTEEKLFGVGQINDSNSIILHRSLYILKRKFEIYDADVKKLYREFEDETHYAMNFDKFLELSEEIFFKICIQMAEVQSGKDLFKSELLSRQIQERELPRLQVLFKEHVFKNLSEFNRQVSEAKGYPADPNDLRQAPVHIGSNLNFKEDEENDEELEENENFEKPKENEERLIKEDKSNNRGENKVVTNLPDEKKNFNIDQNLRMKEKAMSNNPHSNFLESNENYEDPNFKSYDPQENDRFEMSKIEQLKEEKLTRHAINANEDQLDVSKIEAEGSLKNKLNLGSLKVTPIDMLYAEVYPFALADFLEKNPKIVLLDIKGDLKKETRTLFDADLIKRLEDETKYDNEKEHSNQVKELLYEKLNIEKSIRTNEDLLVQKQNVGLNTVYIAQTIQKLAKQKKAIERKLANLVDKDVPAQNLNLSAIGSSSELPVVNDSKILNSQEFTKKVHKKPLTVDDIRTANLKEVFDFYSQQHLVKGKGVSFEAIEANLKTINLGEFARIILDFNIKIPKETAAEIFKKSIDFRGAMDFDEFKVF